MIYVQNDTLHLKLLGVCVKAINEVITTVFINLTGGRQPESAIGTVGCNQSLETQVTRM